MRRRRRNRIIVLIFALLFILCAIIILRASLSLPYREVDLSKLAKVSFEGFNGDGKVNIVVDDAAVDKLLASVKADQDDAWLKTDEVDDADYANFRQSLYFTTPRPVGLSNGESVDIVAGCDKQLAKKLKIGVKESSAKYTVTGLRDVTKITLDDVFKDLDVSFSGVSPALTISIANNSTQPLVKRMVFEIEDPKEFYATGDIVRIHAVYTDDMASETGYAVDRPHEECVRDYEATSDTYYLASAEELPSDILKKAIDAGKRAFKDANEYGVRIFCEANLVPVYINKKATFKYSTPDYVSSYFKTVRPENAGQLGLSYNDLDIIYEVRISQADGVSCMAYGAVRFSDIIRNADGSYTYDFSSPALLSESYFSDRVKKNVVESYRDTHDIERVYP